MDVLPAGERAVLVEVDSQSEVLALFQTAGDQRPMGVEEIVPAARTLLVCFDPAVITVGAVARWLRDLAHRVVAADVGAVLSSLPGRRVEIPVRYVGEDLEEVAQMLGLTPAQVIERHAGCDYLAAFAGFAPGFVYLTGGDPCFDGVSRRLVPRTRVPSSSVAVAGGYSAVYPLDSPGGWRLLGVTPLRMWDLGRREPALIQPGFQVRFRDLAALDRTYSLPPEMPDEPAAESAAPPTSVEDAAGAPSRTWLTVLDTGLQTLVQDLGRPGMTALGISRSGVLDRGAMRLANQLVGNPAGTAVLENVLGGLRLACHGRAVVAVTGAQVAVSLTTSSGMRVPAAADSRVVMEDGQVLRLGRPRAGMRCYVAVQGGWDVAPVLGSRATDVLAGIGPAPLKKEDRLEVGRLAPATRGSGGTVMRLSGGDVVLPQPGDLVTLDVTLGPRDDWFDAAALRNLVDQEWLVTPQSNRVGLRLAGDQPLTRARAGELHSEGMVAGAIEVPPSGQPVLFLADHPLTGGYPVIAVVADRNLDTLAQVSPGVRLKFSVPEVAVQK